MDNSSLSWAMPVALRPHVPSTDKSHEIIPSYRFLAYFITLAVSICSFIAVAKLKPWLKVARSQELHERPLWYPHKDPILGLDILFAMARAVYSHRFLEVTAELISHFGGTVTYLSLGRQGVYTIDPANLYAMLSDRTRFHDFGLGATRKNSLQPLFGNGVFNSDGPVWQHHRSTLRPILARVTTAEIDIFEIHLQKLIKSVPADGSTVDLQQVFNALALDISTHLFMGTSTNTIHSLSDKISPISIGQNFAAAFEHCQRAVSGIDDFSLSGLCWRILFGDRKLKRSLQKIHSFIDESIEQASQCFEEQSKMSPAGVNESQTVFDKLLCQGRSKEDIKYDILNLLSAGKDSIASFLSSTWYVICQRPDVCDNLRAEIGGLKGQRPTLEGLFKLPYLRMVLQEVLRLYPPVAANQRTAEVDTILPRGGGADGKSPLHVPRGASVGYSVYAMHRLEEFFGEDASEFRPERWLEIKPKAAYMPFHAGPRTCLGQHLSLCLVKYATIRLLQYYEGVENRNVEPWQERLGLSCSSRHGVKVGLAAYTPAR
ncbi:cytochrome P450 [Penicillium angulare]|uniref:cytochrome P450 n=1 Tax=Penicillium angulare TaxID=116970 RepID=UPI002540154B|nr:cytochrome P450 [Penicillium angulare]KAJ5281722.1 cytochrome P450 [Penicillium angulare]